MDVKKEVIAATVISQWREGERPTVSIEAAMYSSLFPFIPVQHTVHDQTGTPIFLIVNREDAIQRTCDHYGLKLGKELPDILPQPIN